LDFVGSELKDLSELRYLTNLTFLKLAESKVSSLAPLAGLDKLIRLDLLGGSQISDISPLSHLTQLAYLDLSQTNVSDISPLRNLNHLTSLVLSGTPVSDMSPLSQLTNLKYLNLRGSRASDLSSLQKLENLRISMQPTLDNSWTVLVAADPALENPQQWALAAGRLGYSQVHFYLSNGRYLTTVGAYAVREAAEQAAERVRPLLKGGTATSATAMDLSVSCPQWVVRFKQGVQLSDCDLKAQAPAK
jgi:hypothetical protein